MKKYIKIILLTVVIFVLGVIIVRRMEVMWLDGPKAQPAVGTISSSALW